MIYKEESGYIQLLKDTLNNGIDTEDRTGVGCRKVYNAMLQFDLSDDRFPLPTVRNTPLRYAFEEFWMFLRGETNTKLLEEKGIDIWKGNTSREFLDNRGLTHLPEGDIGKAYGYQLRNFNGVDQLERLVCNLKNHPFSRRHYVTMWNPSELDEMALTPCWHSHQFNVEPFQRSYYEVGGGTGTLHLTVFARSADLVFGTPFNYQQYALYLKCMAELTGYDTGILTCVLTDAHIYHNQIEYAQELVERSFQYDGCPELYIRGHIDNLHDMLNLKFEDLIVENHRVNRQPFVTPKPPMAV